MKAIPLPLCPGCGALADAPLLRLPAEPVVLNYRYYNPHASLNSVRAPLELAECRSCGLIYNAVFQPALVLYDEHYENSQAHSPRFNAHLVSIISTLTEQGVTPSTRILEIGCGKGDFLKTMHETMGCEGVGYDTSYEGPEMLFGNKIQFHKRYYTLSEEAGKFDLIICRHVVEHVPQIGNFIQFLAHVSSKFNGALVVVETPAFEWIADNKAFWDIFYEHCNYFTTLSLRSLFENNQIDVCFHGLVFDGQYQLLGGRSGPGGGTGASAPVFKPTLAEFEANYRRKLHALADKIDRMTQGKNWGIWGAGAKGITLANRLPCPPSFLIDSNIKKQGCYVPGTNIPILSPGDARLDEASMILIANSAYRPEISSILEELGRSVRLEDLE